MQLTDGELHTLEELASGRVDVTGIVDDGVSMCIAIATLPVFVKRCLYTHHLILQLWRGITSLVSKLKVTVILVQWQESYVKAVSQAQAKLQILKP